MEINSLNLGGAKLSKIVGGSASRPNEFPYQVYLSNNGNFDCGGAIINALFILTAAHCVKYKQPNRMTITAGDYNRFLPDGTRQVRNVSHFLLHEDYNWTTDENDIALLILSEPLELGLNVDRIRLPLKPTEYSGLATVTGWGKQDDGKTSGILMKLRIPLVSRTDCQKAYRRTRTAITETMLCAGATGQDSCQGDSGGPLVCQDKFMNSEVLCGIVSFGNGCGRPGYPGVYTEVSKYVEWVKLTMKKFAMKSKCRSDYFYCIRDNTCIPRRFLCNGANECSDGSDENNCQTSSKTPALYFRCSNGISIRQAWLCDKFDDCGDHSDEDKCHFRGNSTVCPGDKFTCRADGRCIEKYWACDRLSDCDDNSDETGCTTIATSSSPNVTPAAITTIIASSTVGKVTTRLPGNCSPNQYLCRKSLPFRFCILSKWVCDGDRDCILGEDEDNCPPVNDNHTFVTSIVRPPPPVRVVISTLAPRPPSVPTVTENPSWIEILSSTVAPTAILSTTNDNEIANNYSICQTDQFHCPGKYGFCIPIGFKCDGEADCVKGEDEWNCSVTSVVAVNASNGQGSTSPLNRRPKRRFQKKCGREEFQCNDGKCIYEAFRCDFDHDCDDGSDEVSCGIHSM